ncbi:hypothetical protein PISMIDRAFT_680933, partial [Pisolithus microcarpus 441]
ILHVPQAIDMDLFIRPKPCCVLHIRISVKILQCSTLISATISAPDYTLPQAPGISSAQDRA